MSVSLTHAFTSGLSDGSTAYTGNFTSGSNTITSVNPTPPASGATGWKLFGGPFAAGTTIASVSGSTITMSANANATSTGATFYSGDGQVQASDWNAQHTLTLAQGNILGRLAAAGTGAATEIPLSFDASNNATFPAQIFAPSGTQSGIVPGMQFYRLNSPLAGANVNTAQSVLGVGVTLSASTVYAFQAVYAISKTAGATSHTIGLGFGGTATLNNIGYLNLGLFKSTGFTGITAPDVASYIQTASNTTVTASTTAASVQYVANISGTVSVNASGTFIPQYTLSAAPGGAYTTAAGAYFTIYPIGAAGANVSIGAWA